MLSLSVSASCQYQECDQNGHSVCPVVADWTQRAKAVLAAVPPDSPQHAEAQALVTDPDMGRVVMYQLRR